MVVLSSHWPHAVTQAIEWAVVPSLGAGVLSEGTPSSWTLGDGEKDMDQFDDL